MPQRAPEEIEALVRALVERLTQQGAGANQIGTLIGQLMEKESFTP